MVDPPIGFNSEYAYFLDGRQGIWAINDGKICAKVDLEFFL